jgi:hypothetical protein
MNSSNPQDPGQYEQACLNGINEIYRLLVSRMGAFKTKPWHSLQEIAELVSELNGQWDRLCGYGAAATYLGNLRRPALGERLKTILSDLKTTIQTCNKMYHDTATSMQGITAQARLANAASARAFQEEYSRRQAAFDEANRQWSDNFKNTLGN